VRALVFVSALMLSMAALCAEERDEESPVEPPRAESPRPESPHMLSGQVSRVLDGDTLEVMVGKRRLKVHVNGVDAPEARQPWGKQARAALEQMVVGQSVDMLPIGSDRGSKLTAVVFVGESEVGAALVSAGNAWADRRALRPSDAGLCEVEQKAREQRLGLWALPPAQRIAPWEYRGGILHRARADYTHETAENCMSVALGKRAKRPAPSVAAPAAVPAAAQERANAEGTSGP
jgi:endonuclease YncB( thermonuclease family)